MSSFVTCLVVILCLTNVRHERFGYRCSIDFISGMEKSQEDRNRFFPYRNCVVFEVQKVFLDKNKHSCIPR